MSYSFSSPNLLWAPNEFFEKSLVFYNDIADGKILVVDVPAPDPGQSAFTWGTTPRTNVPAWLPDPRFPNAVRASQCLSIAVKPPPPGSGSQVGHLIVKVFDTVGNLLESRDVPCINNDASVVTKGDLVLAAFQPNPAGGDLDGEGEFLEIQNLTPRDISFDNFALTQLVFDQRGQSQESSLQIFKPDGTRADFGLTCVLPANKTLRVLTRQSRGLGDDTPTRYFLGKKSPVWNNAGDRMRLYADDKFQSLLISVGYGSELNNGANFPTAPPPPAPPGQQVVFDKTIAVDAGLQDWTPVFDVEDGDTVTLTTGETTIAADFVNGVDPAMGTIAQFAKLANSRLPSGRVLVQWFLGGRSVEKPTTIEANDAAPLPGGPYGALLFGIAQKSPDGSILDVPSPMVVADGTPVTLAMNTSLTLALVTNDTYGNYFDNSGGYAVRVTVRR